MSCFIVSNETLGRVVHAAATKDKHNYEYLGKAFEKLRYDLAVDGGRLAHDLFDLNVAAFCERYPADEDAPEGQRTRYPEDIPEFEFFQLLPGRLNRATLIQAHKSATCLRYNCSDGDVERPLFKALEEFIGDLESHLVTSDPAWETALWG